MPPLSVVLVKIPRFINPSEAPEILTCIPSFVWARYIGKHYSPGTCIVRAALDWPQAQLLLYLYRYRARLDWFFGTSFPALYTCVSFCGTQTVHISGCLSLTAPLVWWMQSSTFACANLWCTHSLSLAGMDGLDGLVNSLSARLHLGSALMRPSPEIPAPLVDRGQDLLRITDWRNSPGLSAVAVGHVVIPQPLQSSAEQQIDGLLPCIAHS
ncbi:hypothetical protein B0T26DRAFT_456526 [Lasiosphaeria miniovina]|uniref:Uncharacterized protein n=1 Tax=Lasiosphaeria miniovina TaxID=1954250 RepID=A0AA40DMA7_9PEZI|nr:uncharacterized protein B0T26DRAFT_456526 [Lasiosphaeria miniovina]KAK0706476.1 hypothetical protein B0T26DRAFT_456526 [Lasiosphaeria miniovina]